MSGGPAMQAALTWVDGGFSPGIQVSIGSDGRIAGVEHGATGAPTHPGHALLPGFINAHSHAFQRGLRGLGEVFPGDQEDFWSWRKAMYGLVEELDGARLHQLSLSAFQEMRRAGITSVGEFHYLHHARGEEAFAGDRIVLAAAAEAGIRIVLLSSHYVQGGFNQPLAGGQCSFDTTDLDTYWSAFDTAAAACGVNQSMGVVAHSIRAVPPEQLVELHAEAKARGLCMHMHVEEQVQEIEECRKACGCTPTRLIVDRLSPGSEFTAVHSTHTDPVDLEEFIAGGAGVCLCPLTEANLGDGFPDLDRMRSSNGRICLGSDSNARISMLEEMRMLELGHRLHGRRRGAARDESGRIDRTLLQMATLDGARSLGLEAGEIVPGALADLQLVDLSVDTLAHVDAEHLAAALVLGADREAITATCVGGAWSDQV